MHRILKDFFHALQGNTSSLTSFLGTWSALDHAVRTNPGSLPGEELRALDTSASVISIIASDILQLQIKSEKIGEEIIKDVSTIIDKEMRNLSINDESSKQTRYSKGTSSSTPAYIKPSYTWLLSNLHNPYPSKEVKKTIAQQTRCSVKDIDAWFIDVRKRIGWNKIRKMRFSNKQEKIVAAATHIFKPKPSSFTDDLSATLISDMDANDAYRSEFIVMASDAKSLYADKFPDLVSSVSYGLMNNAVPYAAPKKLPELHNTHSATHNPQIDYIDSYPTPQPSPNYHADESPIPTPSLGTHVVQPQSRKRHQSSLDGLEGNDEDVSTRPLKRFRPDINPIIEVTAVANIPSPANTIDLSDDTPENIPSSSCTIDSSAIASLPPPSDTTGSSADTLEDSSSSAHIVTQDLIAPEIMSLKRKRRLSDGERRAPAKHPHISITPKVVIAENPVVSETSRLKRKRRLSDGESQCHPKRPHNALAQPRLQTVSDPFPISKTLPEDLETWAQNDEAYDFSNIPSPANLEDPLSQTTLLQVSYGRYAVSTSHTDPYPQEPFTYLVTDELSASVSSDGSKSSLEFVAPPYYAEYLPNSIFDVANSTSSLLNFHDISSASAYDLSLSIPYTPSSEDSHQSPLASEWLEYLQSGNSYTSLDSLVPIMAKNANLNDTTPHAIPDSNSSATKRAKIQALNEQIRLLEAEL